MEILGRIPTIRRIREAKAAALSISLEELRKKVVATTELRESLSAPVTNDQNYPTSLQKGTFTYPGRNLRSTRLKDAPAYRGQWPLQRILMRNLFEILHNIQLQAEENKISHIDKVQLKGVNQNMAKSLIIIESAIQRKAPTKDGEIPYSRWWRSACRSIQAKDSAFIIESLREAAAFTLTNSHPATSDAFTASCRTMINHIEGGRRPSIIARSAYAVGTAFDVVGHETKIGALSHAGKALQSMSSTPPEEIVSLE